MLKNVRIVLSAVIFLVSLWIIIPLLIEKYSSLTSPENQIGNWIYYISLILVIAMTLSTLINSIIGSKSNDITVNIWLLLGVLQVALTLVSFINNEITKSDALSSIITTTAYFVILASLLNRKPAQEKQQ